MPDQAVEQHPAVAVIDIGASAIRLVVAQPAPGRGFQVLEEASRGVLLGRDVFAGGRVGAATMDAAIRALAGFRQIMDGYGVTRVRAVATSAVREASNADTFLDRVRVRTQIDVEVIDGSEESRLTYLGVRERLKSHPAFASPCALLVEVGGGSTDLTRLSHGQPEQAGVFPLGSIRLRQRLAAWHGAHAQRIQLLTSHVAKMVGDVLDEMPIADAQYVVALGNDVRFAARQLSANPDDSPSVISRAALFAFCEEINGFDEEALVARFRLSPVDAETLVPAMLVHRALLEATAAHSIVVADVSLRAGLLLALVAETEADPGDFIPQVLSSAAALGARYHYDEPHAASVAHLALRLFDDFRTEHALAARDRLLLEVAARLHDIGQFVSLRGHHKHSLYLLQSSEIFGLSRDDMQIVGNIARYHRRGLPQKSHPEFFRLDRDERVRVTKLAGILRLANALDAARQQKVSDVRVTEDHGAWVVEMIGQGDLTMEGLAAQSRSDLLGEVFGRRIIVRGAGAGA
jgi:exopolyphosphatase/guanosine-5'-triphosphate,3'-diphosphate pyrophosphatase